jgi:hypothetical protein
MYRIPIALEIVKRWLRPLNPWPGRCASTTSAWEAQHGEKLYNFHTKCRTIGKRNPVSWCLSPDDSGGLLQGGGKGASLAHPDTGLAFYVYLSPLKPVTVTKLPVSFLLLAKTD